MIHKHLKMSLSAFYADAIGQGLFKLDYEYITDTRKFYDL